MGVRRPAGTTAARSARLAVLCIAAALGSTPSAAQDRERFLVRGSGALWHFGFHAEVDFAMDLIDGRIPRYLDHFFDTATASDGAIDEEDRAFYADCYRERGVMRASLRTYAAFPEDAEANAAFLEGGKLEVPTLVMGGSASLGPVIGEMAREIAEDPQVVVSEGSGHFVQNEAPARLTQEIARFVDRHSEGSR